MAMTEDLSVFFNTDEFADDATLTAVGAGVVIYDENGTILEQFGVQTSEPAALCPLAQWPAVAEGQTLTIHFAAGDQAFTIRSRQAIADGALVLLALAKA